jgi:glutamate-ammonia-ligase adenylyltransferase
MGFAVIGYGKLGRMELGYGSDLDLVFLHGHSGAGCTNGPRSIDSSHFYLKLAQRIVHLFATRTTSGELYEVDMRLRPSGASGLLVSEIEQFGQYQLTEAWTWEHQALVRARFVFGDYTLAGRFSDLRGQILQQARDQSELAKSVRDMRTKMRDHLLQVEPGQFDLKQSAGGIADIEFIAQYLVLAHAHQHHDLTIWSDNVRIFEVLADLELLPVMHAQHLTQTYCWLRDENHELTLQQLPGKISVDLVAPKTDAVIEIYNEILQA